MSTIFPLSVQNILLEAGRAVTALVLNPMKPFEMAVGTQDSMIRVYDRRRLGSNTGQPLLFQAFNFNIYKYASRRVAK